jgi:microcompartment protein CcmK/EutM
LLTHESAIAAAPGDTVLVIDEENDARQIIGIDPGAVGVVIVGVVDEVAVKKIDQLIRVPYSVSI